MFSDFSGYSQGAGDRSQSIPVRQEWVTQVCPKV